MVLYSIYFVITLLYNIFGFLVSMAIINYIPID